MRRNTFLRLAAFVGFLVGLAAYALPLQLLAGKGIVATLHEPVVIWVREVGALIFASGIMAWLARDQPDSPMLRVYLIGNACMHLGLLPVELSAYAVGVISSAGGVVPNSILHVVFALAFGFYATRIPKPAALRATE